MSGARAAAPLLVLALLPLLLLGGLALLVAAVLSLAGSGVLGAGGALLLLLGSAAAVAAVVQDVLRVRRPPARGVELLRAEHPRLWAEVDALAAALGVEPPCRLLVVPPVAVSLSTAGGRRELSIGLPLLAATSRVQLRALLARELAHEAGRSSWPTAPVSRARDAALAATAAFEDSEDPWLLVRLVRPYLEVAAWAAQDLESAADAQAAQVVGSEAAATALRRAVELELAWEVLHREYVPLAVHAQRRPALVHGLHHVLGARSAALEEAASAQEPRLAARLAALLAVPVRVPADAEDDAAACTLLDGGFGRLELLESSLHRSSLPAATWSELAERGGLAACAQRTAALVRAAPAAGVASPATLAGVLDAVGRGRGTALVAPLVPAGATPQERADVASRLLAQHLAAAVSHALCLSGAFVHRVDWTGPCRLTSVHDAQQAVDVDGLMAHVHADPAQVPELVRLLGRHGAVLTAELGSVVAGAVVLEGLATQLAGPDRRRHDLLAWSSGLLVLPTRTRSRWQLDVRRLARSDEQAGQRRVAALLAADLPTLRAVPGARWIGSEEVLAGRLSRRRGGWGLDVRVRLGLPLELRSTAETRESGTPLDAARTLLAERGDERAWQASTLGVAVPA